MFKWIKQLVASPDNGSNAIDNVGDSGSIAPTSPTQTGDEYMASGDFDAAITCYRDAITQHSQDAAPHCGLAYALMANGSTREAKEAALQALAIDANHVDAH